MSEQAPTSPLAPAGLSPLAEADPNSINTLIAERIDEIFNKPPLLLSDADLAAAVEYYRKERQRFMVESQLKQSASRNGGPRKAVPKSVKEALPSVEDLF